MEMLASSFWTSGMYSKTQRQWKWDNGVSLASNAPWGYGFPKTSAQNSQSRITAFFESSLDMWLQTQYATEQARYICEIKSSVSQPACLQPTVQYQMHLQGNGWEQVWYENGQISGTTGQSRRVEAIRIRIEGAPGIGKMKRYFAR
jgi:uncharacterized protein YjdB